MGACGEDFSQKFTSQEGREETGRSPRQENSGRGNRQCKDHKVGVHWSVGETAWKPGEQSEQGREWQEERTEGWRSGRASGSF